MTYKHLRVALISLSLLGGVGLVAQQALPPVVVVPGSPSMLNAFTPVGGTTASFPAFRRTTTNIDVRLADDSGYSALTASNLLFTSGLFGVNQILSTTAPTISSGFGTSPAILSSNGTSSFRVNVGTGAVATSGVIGLPAAAAGWNCQVTDLTNNTVTRETASTTTTATVTAAAAWAASDTLIFNCGAY